MSTPPPPQQPPPAPPQQYPQQQPYPAQQYPQQYPPGQPPPHGAPPPPTGKSKMPLIIGIVVAVVVIVVVLAILFLFVLKPGGGTLTATQFLDDYDYSNFNYKSYNDGDTITIRDKITDVDSFGGSTTVNFAYTGSDPVWQFGTYPFVITDELGNCGEGDFITIKGKVVELFGLETVANWDLTDSSECT